MARKKSEFLGAFGKAFQVFKALADEVLNLGGGDEDLRRIETDSGLRRKLAALLVGKATEAPANIFKVFVDYGKPLQDMIAAGKYDYANPNITEKYFPVKGSGKSEVKVELVHYNKAMTSDQVLADFKERGLKPAPIEVLCAVGKERPELQREFPIVALGSVWQHRDGRRGVPYLGRWNDERRLTLRWFGDDWYEHCRFLVVRES